MLIINANKISKIMMYKILDNRKTIYERIKMLIQLLDLCILKFITYNKYINNNLKLKSIIKNRIIFSGKGYVKKANGP